MVIWVLKYSILHNVNYSTIRINLFQRSNVISFTANLYLSFSLTFLALWEKNLL